MGRTAPTLRTSSTPATLLLQPRYRSAQTSMLTRSDRISEKRFMCSGVHAHKQAPQALGAEGALAWGALCVALGLAATQQPP